MYGYRHPVREYKDGAIRVIRNQNNQDTVLVYDQQRNGLRVETDKTIVQYILAGEKNICKD